MKTLLEGRIREGWKVLHTFDYIDATTVAAINGYIRTDYRLRSEDGYSTVQTDIVQRSQYLAQNVFPRPYLASECPEPRQEGDEYVCTKCTIRWDTHEDKPACQHRSK